MIFGIKRGSHVNVILTKASLYGQDSLAEGLTEPKLESGCCDTSVTQADISDSDTQNTYTHSQTVVLF